MTTRDFRTVAALSLAALLGGCASVSEDAGLSMVKQMDTQSLAGSAQFPARHASTEEAATNPATSPLPLESVLTVDQAVQIALANNRELAAARVRIAEAQARLIQAGLWPNPELEVGGRFDSAFANEGEHGFAAALSQPFTVSGRIAAQKALARVDIDRTAAEIADLERRLAGDVRRAFAELFALDEQIKVQGFLISVNDDFLSATRAALAAGQVSEKDINAIQIALQQARQREKTFEIQRRTRLLELDRLIGRPADSELSVSGQLELRPLPDLSAFTLDNALQHRPDFLASRLEVDAAIAERRLALAERFDDWRVGLSYELDKSVIDGAPPQNTDQFIGMRLAIPLPLFNRNQGRIAEAIARTTRAQISVEAVKLQISQELGDALQRVKALEPLLDSYSSGILKRAEDNVKLVEGGYRQGLASIAEVIQSRQQFNDLKSSYIDTMREYQLARIELQVASGIPIQLNEVNKP